jgi:uncharacterized RDD family membrane protein YckC
MKLTSTLQAGRFLLAAAFALAVSNADAAFPRKAGGPNHGYASAATAAEADDATKPKPEAEDATNAAGSKASAESSPSSPSAGETNTDPKGAGKARITLLRHSSNRDAVVSLGQDRELKEGETAEAVVVIGGNAIVKGKVRAAAVTVGGNLDISGEVGDAVVAVMGNIKLGPTAKVRGDVVSVGGTVEKAEGAEVGGQIQDVSIGFGGMNLPKLDWLKQWLAQCVFKFRPLAPQVGWVWAVMGVFFLLYLLIALAFPGAVQACVSRLNDQPATTFLTGLLTKLLVPFVLGLLLITGIGIIGIPFLVAAAVLAKLFGKVAIFIYLGQQLGRAFKTDALQKTLPAFLVGWILVTLLYMVPFLGLFTLIVLDIWALGVAVMAVVSRSRREAPPRPAPLSPPVVPASWTAPVQPLAPASDGVPSAAAAASLAAPLAPPPAFPGATATPAGEVPRIPPTIPSPPTGLQPPEALAYPRASFWERMGAGFLDVVLVGILSHFIPFPAAFLVGSVAYFTGMWAWKGTTVGNVVLNLKVVRLDGQPVTFAVALVRALAAWLSAVVLFLGFFWIAWDQERQGWHDKIAGTTVVKLPKGMSLISL